MKKMIAWSMLVLSRAPVVKANMHSPRRIRRHLERRNDGGHVPRRNRRGIFRIEKQPDWDDVRNAPWSGEELHRGAARYK